nr:uncharacterized protein LOC125422104 [Ziziphus jujuba var. spinosa]
MPFEKKKKILAEEKRTHVPGTLFQPKKKKKKRKNFAEKRTHGVEKRRRTHGAEKNPRPAAPAPNQIHQPQAPPAFRSTMYDQDINSNSVSEDDDLTSHAGSNLHSAKTS